MIRADYAKERIFSPFMSSETPTIKKLGMFGGVFTPNLDFVHLRKWTKRCIRQNNANVDFLHGRMNPPIGKKTPQSAWGG